MRWESEPLARRAPTRSQPAWQTVAEMWAGTETESDDLSPAVVERARPLDRHIQRNSDAEYAFYRLHGRFQRYAAEQLFPDERILAFVPWTATVFESWRGRVGRWLAPGERQLVEGILVVTDRQVLLLRDAAEPIGKTLHWGYAVHATTPELLAGVSFAVQPDGNPTLRLDLAAGAARETLAWAFPAAVAGDVARRASARTDPAAS